MSRIKTILSNLLIGIPGGCLIFMGMLMFSALLGQMIPSRDWIMLSLLCLTALIVGMLAHLLRPINGFGAALACGAVAALIILFLWVKASPGSEGNLVFGPAGMLATVLFSALGGWLRLRMRKGTG